MENYNKEKNISENNLKLLAYKLLPEIKKYFSQEKVQKEFQEWLKENNNKVDKWTLKENSNNEAIAQKSNVRIWVYMLHHL